MGKKRRAKTDRPEVNVIPPLLIQFLQDTVKVIAGSVEYKVLAEMLCAHYRICWQAAWDAGATKLLFDGREHTWEDIELQYVQPVEKIIRDDMPFKMSMQIQQVLQDAHFSLSGMKMPRAAFREILHRRAEQAASPHVSLADGRGRKGKITDASVVVAAKRLEERGRELSIDNLAIALDVTNSAVYKWRNGKPLDEAIKQAQARLG
jgi:hypothetical protein